MAEWMVPVVALLGVLGQWYVSSRASARRDGVMDEKLLSYGKRLDKHGDELDVLRVEAGKDRGRIVALETRAGITYRG